MSATSIAIVDDHKVVSRSLKAYLESFPDLKVVVSHFGGGIGSTLNRIEDYYEVEWKENQTGDNILKHDFKYYMDKIFIDTAGVLGWPNGMNSALGAVNPDRIVFGSDYPSEISAEATPTRASLRGYVKTIGDLDIPESDRKAILGDSHPER